jgi:hypothetical protein
VPDALQVKDARLPHAFAHSIANRHQPNPWRQSGNGHNGFPLPNREPAVRLTDYGPFNKRKDLRANANHHANSHFALAAPHRPTIP